MNLADNPTDLGTNSPEALTGRELNNALPTDAIDTKNSQHRLDKTALTSQSGGTLRSAGQGGDAIGKDSLLPAEQEVLKHYFK